MKEAGLVVAHSQGGLANPCGEPTPLLALQSDTIAWPGREKVWNGTMYRQYAGPHVGLTLLV